MKILFVDMTAPKPYTSNTLRSYAMGGSEATLLRVARGLAKDGLDVYVFQGCDPHRTEMSIDGIFHCNELTQISPDVVVHMRTALFVEGFKEAYPSARHVVWLHDIVTEPEPELAGQEIVCVSDWHSEQVWETLHSRFGTDENVGHIYNPVDTSAAVKQAKVPGRLGFFSSPHKGLEQVVRAFQLACIPGTELVYANPGYMPDQRADGCVNLGQLPHYRVLEEMSKCEVLFYPQTVFPETFGLVLAEANAMGTEVLAHDFGAAKEVLGSEGNAVLDCTEPKAVSEALEMLLTLKIEPKADERFSLENVIKEWKQLLGAV